MSKKIYRIMVVTLSLLSGPYFAKAATYTAKLSGNWNSLLTWGSVSLPTAADIVIIPSPFTVTVNITTAVASTVTVNTGGKLTISNGDKLTISGALSNAGTITTNKGSLIIGGSLTNSGSLTVSANGTLTFDGAANSTITSSGGTYSVSGTVVMNMGAAATALDVQDPNFISGINSGGKYYFTFTQGTFKMDNTGTLNNAYNSGPGAALTIPFGVTIESDNGTMNLAGNGGTGSVLLSGKLLMNGGTVNVQTGQGSGAGPANDFQYYVNGGTPQLYINSGSLTVGGGFNPYNATSYIDFNMTGGTMVVTSLQPSNNPTFQLQNVAGGKTVMSGGLITIVEPGLGSNPDLDMGGSSISPYTVTGGTVQIGNSSTQAAGGWFGIMPYSTTNYPNIDIEPGTTETIAAHAAGNFNFLSLYINSNATFDASNGTSGSSMNNLDIMSGSGTYAFDDEGGFIPGTGTVEFSGGLSQLITSAAVSPVSFYNLTVANTSGNVVLGVATQVTNQLAFTSGKLDASADPLTITNGAKAITGVGNSSYVITGDGVTKTGYLAIQKLPTSTTTTFPIGTSSYYLPVTVNPGTNGNTAYSAYVYPGVTTNAQSNGTSLSSALLAGMTDATWAVSRTAGAGSATLGLNWASAGTALEGVNFRGYGTQIGITQYSGGTWSTANGTGNESTHTASATFTSFTQFSAIGTPIALPLVLADLTAAAKGNTVALAWAAFPDGQPGSFTIQRSSDGLSWNTIGVVQADASATTEIDYNYTDVSPMAGEDYYRLYIQNADGSTTYSPVRVVAFTAMARVSVYPNPADAALTVSFGNSSRALGIRLVNTAGTVLQSKVAEAGAGTLTVSTGAYPTGIYYVEILDGGQLLQTTAVMVAH